MANTVRGCTATTFSAYQIADRKTCKCQVANTELLYSATTLSAYQKSCYFTGKVFSPNEVSYLG